MTALILAAILAAQPETAHGRLCREKANREYIACVRECVTSWRPRGFLSGRECEFSYCKPGGQQVFDTCMTIRDPAAFLKFVK